MQTRIFSITHDAAKKLIGESVSVVDPGGSVCNTGEVLDVRYDSRDNTVALSIQGGRSWWICEGWSVIVDAQETPVETPADRVERLRAELAAAEVEAAAVDGAPDGFRWEGSGRDLKLSGKEEGCDFRMGLTSSPNNWVYVNRTPGAGCPTNIAHIPFEAAAAFVDRVRRDRGEATPEAAAPVSEAPAASLGVLEGWVRTHDCCGPCWTKGGVRIEMDGCGDVVITGRDDSIDVAPDVLRGFLACLGG